MGTFATLLCSCSLFCRLKPSQAHPDARGRGHRLTCRGEGGTASVVIFENRCILPSRLPPCPPSPQAERKPRLPLEFLSLETGRRVQPPGLPLPLPCRKVIVREEVRDVKGKRTAIDTHAP